MRNRRKATAIVLCTLLAVSACTSPPASLPTPAASNAASDLPVINTSISHEVPTTLEDVQLFGRALGEFNTTVVPVSGFKKVQPDDPRIISEPIPEDCWNNCESVFRPFDDASEFALFYNGGECSEAPGIPGVQRNGEFTPFTGGDPGIDAHGNLLTAHAITHSADGVLWTTLNRDDWRGVELMYGDLQTLEASQVIDYKTLLDSLQGTYLLRSDGVLGAQIHGERVILEMFLTDHSERNPEGSFLPYGLVSINIDGNDQQVEITRVSPQSWVRSTPHSQLLVDRVEDGKRVLLERTGIGEFTEVFSIPMDSPQAPPQDITSTWAGILDNQLIVAVGDYLLIAQGQQSTVTIVDLGTPPRGENSGVVNVAISDSHIAWRYRLYAQGLSGIYALNRETLTGNMTVLEEEVNMVTIEGDTLSFNQITYGFDTFVGVDIKLPLP